MTDPSPSKPDAAEYIAAAASAHTYESFGRAIASAILAASADPTHGLNVTAAAQPSDETHGQHCYTVSISVDGSYHYIQVCFAV
jgi:hypothetical protein